MGRILEGIGGCFLVSAYGYMAWHDMEEFQRTRQARPGQVKSARASSYAKLESDTALDCRRSDRVNGDDQLGKSGGIGECERQPTTAGPGLLGRLDQANHVDWTRPPTTGHGHTGH